jgi:hypothetical protein
MSCREAIGVRGLSGAIWIVGRTAERLKLKSAASALSDPRLTIAIAVCGLPSIARAQGPLVGTVATNVPEVRAFAQPPAGFDPVAAPEMLREQFGDWLRPFEDADAFRRDQIGAALSKIVSSACRAIARTAGLSLHHSNAPVRLRSSFALR